MIKEVALSFIKHHIIIKAKNLEHGNRENEKSVILVYIQKRN